MEGNKPLALVHVPKIPYKDSCPFTIQDPIINSPKTTAHLYPIFITNNSPLFAKPSNAAELCEETIALSNGESKLPKYSGLETARRVSPTVHFNMDIRFLSDLRRNLRNKLNVSETHCSNISLNLKEHLNKHHCQPCTCSNPDHVHSHDLSAEYSSLMYHQKPMDMAKSPSDVQCCSIKSYSSEMTSLQRHLSRLTSKVLVSEVQVRRIARGVIKSSGNIHTGNPETPHRLQRIPSCDPLAESSSRNKGLEQRNQLHTPVRYVKRNMNETSKSEGSKTFIVHVDNERGRLVKNKAEAIKFIDECVVKANVKDSHDLLKRRPSFSHQFDLKRRDYDKQFERENISLYANRNTALVVNAKRDEVSNVGQVFQIKLDDQYKNDSTYQTKRSYLTQEFRNKILCEIVAWLNELCDIIYEDINKDDLTNLLFKRLKVCIDRRKQTEISTKSLRIILMKQIYNILYDIPDFLCFTENKSLELYQLAEDLANRIIYVNYRPENIKLKNAMSMKQAASLNKIPSSASENLSGPILVYPLNTSFTPRTGAASSMPSTRRAPRGVQGPPSLPARQPRPKPKNPFDDLDISEITCPEEKQIARLSPEEELYTAKVKQEIDQWWHMVYWLSLPDAADKRENVNFKTTAIEDLANTLVDIAKYKQLKGNWPEKDEKKEYRYRIKQWIKKIEHCDERVQEIYRLYTDFLIENVRKIQVPNLTRSQYGTRKDMVEFDHPSGEWGFRFTGKEILEDAISIWLHERPSNILNVDNKELRGVLIHDLANEIRKNVPMDGAPIPDDVAEQEVKKWLVEVVKPDKIEQLDQLTEDLKHKVKEIPPKKIKLKKHSCAYKFMQQQVIDCAEGWLRERDFYKKSTPQEQHQQERVLRVMADDYWEFENTQEAIGPKRFIGLTNLYTKAKEEQFGTLPVNNGKKMSDLFCESAIYSMFHTLYKHMGEVVELRAPDVPVVDIPPQLEQQVNSWADGIPFKIERYTVAAFENYKKVFMYALTALISKKVDPVVIKGNIEKFLKKAPLKDELLKGDPQFLHSEIEVLYAMLEQNCQNVEPISRVQSETDKIFEEEVIKSALELLKEQTFYNVSESEAKQEQEKFIEYIAKETHEFETSPDAFSPLRQQMVEERYMNYYEQIKTLPFNCNSNLGDNYSDEAFQTFLTDLDRRMTNIENLYFNDTEPVADATCEHKKLFQEWISGLPIRVPTYLEKVWDMYTNRFVGLITETIEEGLPAVELRSLIGKFLKEIPTLDKNLKEDIEYLLEQLNKFHNMLVPNPELEESKSESDVTPPVGNVLPDSLYNYPREKQSPPCPKTGSKSSPCPKTCPGTKDESLEGVCPTPHTWPGSKSLPARPCPRKSVRAGPKSLPVCEAKGKETKQPLWSRKDVDDFFLSEISFCAAEWLREQEFFYNSTPEEQVEQLDAVVQMAKQYHAVESEAGSDKEREICILLHDATDQFKILPVQSGQQMLDIFDEATIEHIVISSFFKRLGDIERFYIFDLPLVEPAPYVTELFDMWLEHLPINVEHHYKKVFNFNIDVTTSILSEFLSDGQSKENIKYVIEGFLLNAPIDECLKDENFMKYETEELYQNLAGVTSDRMYGVSSLPPCDKSQGKPQGPQSFGGIGVHDPPVNEQPSWLHPSSKTAGSWGWTLEPRTPTDLFFEEQVIESNMDWVREQEFYEMSTEDEKFEQERFLREIAMQYHAIEFTQSCSRDEDIDNLIKEAKEMFKMVPIQSGARIDDAFTEDSISCVMTALFKRMNDIELLFSEYTPVLEFCPIICQKFNEWIQEIPINVEKHVQKALDYYIDTFLLMLSDYVVGQSPVDERQNLIQTFLLAIPIEDKLKQDEDWLLDKVVKLCGMVSESGETSPCSPCPRSPKPVCEGPAVSPCPRSPKAVCGSPAKPPCPQRPKAKSPTPPSTPCPKATPSKTGSPCPRSPKAVCGTPAEAPCPRATPPTSPCPRSPKAVRRTPVEAPCPRATPPTSPCPRSPKAVCGAPADSPCPRRPKAKSPTPPSTPCPKSTPSKTGSPCPRSPKDVCGTPAEAPCPRSPKTPPCPKAATSKIASPCPRSGTKTKPCKEDSLESLVAEFLKQFDFADNESKDAMACKLRTEFKKFCPEIQKFVLEKLTKGERVSVPIPIEQFNKELILINSIIDWLKLTSLGKDVTCPIKKPIVIKDTEGKLYYLI